VNTFHGQRLHTEDEVRKALQIDSDVPIVFCDARARLDVQRVLGKVVEHTLDRVMSGAAAS
jgi:hypothetical protein